MHLPMDNQPPSSTCKIYPKPAETSGECDNGISSQAYLEIAAGEIKTAWIVDYTDNRGNRQRKHFQTKKTADTFRINVEGQMQAGTYRAPADTGQCRMRARVFLSTAKGETNAMSE